jgi:hypothetical protein
MTFVKPWPPWLNGRAVVYNNDTSLAQKTAWTEGVIPLQQFIALGVNLTNVTGITIGFSTRGNTTVAGGTGQMYFDDIRLYRPESRSELKQKENPQVTRAGSQNDVAYSAEFLRLVTVMPVISRMRAVIDLFEFSCGQMRIYLCG